MLGLKNVYHHHIHRAKVGIKPERGRETLFQHDTPDDEWMAFVASREWIVITQDYSLHRERAVLSAIKQHKAKVFYLWGAQAPKWEAMRVFMNRYKKILDMAAATSGPFIHRVTARGSFQTVKLDE